MPLNISVIIPVYNAERFLQRAVESVLRQPQVTELILVEDGSNDESLRICKEQQSLSNKIKVFYHAGHANKGVSASRNVGIRQAQNDFVAFLDADDYYLPNRFTAAVSLLDQDKSIDGVYEMTGKFDDAGKIVPYAIIEPVNHLQLFENLQPIGSKVWFHINSLTVKKSVFLQAGLFNESLKTSEDTLQWFMMAGVAKLVPGCISKPVVLNVKTANSLTSNTLLAQKDFMSMFIKLFAWCKKQACVNSRKELVLQTMFFHLSKEISHNPVRKLSVFAKAIIIDPGYILFHSHVFRRFIGSLVGYNKIVGMGKKKLIS